MWITYTPTDHHLNSVSWCVLLFSMTFFINCFYYHHFFRLCCQVLAVGFLKWSMMGVDSGSIRPDIISDKFPVLWCVFFTLLLCRGDGASSESMFKTRAMWFWNLGILGQVEWKTPESHLSFVWSRGDNLKNYWLTWIRWNLNHSQVSQRHEALSPSFRCCLSSFCWEICSSIHTGPNWRKKKPQQSELWLTTVLFTMYMWWKKRRKQQRKKDTWNVHTQLKWCRRVKYWTS